MKTTSSITLDANLLEKVRAENMNLSAWVNIKLKEYFDNLGKLADAKLPLTAHEAQLLANELQAIEDAKKEKDTQEEKKAYARIQRISEIHHELNELTALKMKEIDEIKLGIIGMKQRNLHQELRAMGADNLAPDYKGD